LLREDGEGKLAFVPSSGVKKYLTSGERKSP
jgi:hypothetical protein